MSVNHLYSILYGTFSFSLYLLHIINFTKKTLFILNPGIWRETQPFLRPFWLFWTCWVQLFHIFECVSAIVYLFSWLYMVFSFIWEPRNWQLCINVSVTWSPRPELWTSDIEVRTIYGVFPRTMHKYIWM